MTLPLTPSQTVGPYLAIGLPWPDGPDVVPEGTPGRIRIFGRLFDGDGEVIPDGMIETWQAGPDGEFGPGFRGFGRCPTDGEGAWHVFTVKPGRLGDGQAPHIDVNVFARGMLNRCVTRIYFADEEQANAADPLLSSIEDQAVRDTLIARVGDAGLRFDIHLQGERQTAFLDV